MKINMFVLFNKELGINLEHPHAGSWYIADLQKAQELLIVCRSYVQVLGLDENNFVIKNIKTDEIIEN